jgi:hypothetical protein
VNIVYCFVQHGDRESGFMGVSWIDMETMGSSVLTTMLYLYAAFIRHLHLCYASLDGHIEMRKGRKNQVRSSNVGTVV